MQIGNNCCKETATNATNVFPTDNNNSSIIGMWEREDKK
jgi:hypothetical protein